MPTPQDGGFESAVAQHLFPTMTWKLRLARDARDQLDGLIRTQVVRDLGSERSVSQGQCWQSKADLHRHAPLSPLHDAVQLAASHALAQLHVQRKSMALSSCWVSVHGRQAQLAPTTHPNNYLAGLYCVQAPPGADTIYFHDPRPQTSLLRPPITRASRENAQQSMLRVEPGSLLLFPAWLAYSMHRNDSFESRIYAGFTLMFEQFGWQEPPTQKRH